MSALLKLSGMAALAGQLACAVPLSNAAEVAPELTASLNQSVEPAVFRGWPVLLEIALVHPAWTNSPIVISAAEGPWSNAIAFEVRDAQEALVQWPFQTTPINESVLELTLAAPARLFYWISGENTRQLAAGAYELAATLNTVNAVHPAAWLGTVRAVPVLITVSDEPTALTEEQLEEKQRLLASYALLNDNPARAKRELDTLLSAYPENIGGLSFRAQVLALTNDTAAALNATKRALDVIDARFPDREEPPENLLLMYHSLLRANAPVQLATSISGNVVTIRWLAVPARTYELESSSDLRTWRIRETNFSRADGSITWSAIISTHREFFRVKAR